MDQFLKKKKATAGTQRQYDVNQIINQIDNDPRPAGSKVESSVVKKVDDQWLEDPEDTQETNTQGNNNEKNQKGRTKKKNNEFANWGNIEKEAVEPPKTLTEPEPTQKKGVMRKVTDLQKVQQEAKFVNLEEEFPDLDVDPSSRPKPKPKPQPQHQESQSASQNSSGPRRFVNSKKTIGESFKPLEEEVSKVESPQIQTEAPSTTTETTKPQFSRSEITRQTQPQTQTQTEAPSTTTETGASTSKIQFSRSEMTRQRSPPKTESKEETAESKIKFGGEGPKRFIGAKKETSLVQGKSEADLRREEAERRAEEALQREKEKLVTTERPKLGFQNKKPVDNTVKTENTAPGATVSSDGFQQVEYKLQKKEKSDKKPTTFEHKPRNYDDKPKFNDDKRTEQDKSKKIEQPKEEQPKPVVENAEPKKVSGKVTMTGWGEGGIVTKRVGQSVQF